MNTDWRKTREEFCRLAARTGVDRIAAEIPAHPATVYRLIRGDTAEPSHAIRAGVERLLQQHQTRPEKP
ncbi:MAG: hypothetical protein RLZZ246_710 [Planctomycetota bacterium]